MGEAALSELPGISALRLPLRPWLPEPWRRAALERAGQEVALRIPEGVRRVCKRPRWIPPSEWSVRYRRMPAADAHPGPYRPEFARFAAKVMDTWAQPWVREVWFSGVDQASKTNTMLSCMGWSIEHSPGNIFYQMPDKESADRIMGRKLIPMLTGSPTLAALLSRRADDTGLNGVTLANGVGILPSWAGSPTSTATFSAKYTFSDEIDKMKTVGKEASPIARIRKRVKNHDDGKNFFASTSADLWIYSGVLACVQVWEAAARCPHCHALVVMDEDHLDIPQGATPESLKQRGADVGYFCNRCGERWTEAERRRAGEQGDWVCTKGADEPRPEDVGFLLSTFPLPDQSLSEIAQVVLSARAGDVSAKRDLAHGIKAVDCEEALVERKEDAILLLRDDRPEGLVPSVPIACLTAVADMQKRGFWYKVTAWGYGLEQESWLLRFGWVDSWEALRKIFFEGQYRDVLGNTYAISLRGMDSGGGESEQWADLSRTAECYQWAAANPGVLLFKGVRSMASAYRLTHRDRIPGTNRPLPGSVPLYTLNSKLYKDALAAKLLVSPHDPGAWHLHSGHDVAGLEALSRDPGAKLSHNLGDLARQLCAEGKDEKGGFWVNPKKRANHGWDCSYMELALTDIAQVKYWPPPEPELVLQREERSRDEGRPSRLTMNPFARRSR